MSFVLAIRIGINNYLYGFKILKIQEDKFVNEVKLIPQEERKLREKNMSIVRRYMDYAGFERADRKDIYRKDFRGGCYTKPDGSDDDVHYGHDGSKAEFDKYCVKGFPDWSHFDTEIYQTIDPNIYLTTCKGFGAYNNPVYGYPYYENYFYGLFIVIDGELKEYFEHYNASDQLKQLSNIDSSLKLAVFQKPQREYPENFKKQLEL